MQDSNRTIQFIRHGWKFPLIDIGICYNKIWHRLNINIIFVKIIIRFKRKVVQNGVD